MHADLKPGTVTCAIRKIATCSDIARPTWLQPYGDDTASILVVNRLAYDTRFMIYLLKHNNVHMAAAIARRGAHPYDEYSVTASTKLHLSVCTVIRINSLRQGSRACNDSGQLS
jgi:hypothetical protein